MEYGKPIVPSLVTTSLVDVLPDAFNNTEAVAVGQQRLQGDYIYEARKNIYPLATYSWNDFDTPVTGIVTKLSDKTTITNTTVPVQSDITTIYIEDSSDSTIVGNYYTYTGAGTEIDFTTVDPTNPSGFTLATNMRHLDALPYEESVYWKLIDIKNSLRHLDGTLWNQTIADAGINTITNYYTIDEYLNIIAFFNMECTEVAVTARLQSDSSIVMERTFVNMLDLQGITSPYDWFFTPVNPNKKSAIIRLPIYDKVIIQIEYINTDIPPKVGETLFSRTRSMGQTANRPQGRKKKFDTIRIDENGNKNIVKSNTMINEIRYDIWVKTSDINSRIETWGDLINEDILIIGDESGAYTLMINYGSINDMPYELDTNSSHNKYQISVTTKI